MCSKGVSRNLLKMGQHYLPHSLQWIHSENAQNPHSPLLYSIPEDKLKSFSFVICRPGNSSGASI